jgi:large subunit ribosomal protein L28
MARVCEICGKGPSMGNRIARRGRAKYLGGVGRKITGITRRKFRPNLQRVKADRNGTIKAILVCVQCIRSGAVRRPQVRKPFEIPQS